MPIAAARQPRTVPLSFAQEQLWLDEQLHPGSPLYNVPIALELEGPLDPEVLERALAHAVARHDALSATFPLVDGRPVQRLAPPAEIALRVVAARGDEVGKLAAAAAREPFDSGRGPLVRCTLFRIDDERHLLVFSAHHLVIDYPSTELLFRDVFAAYEALAAGEAPDDGESPPPYDAFVRAERERWAGEQLQERFRSYCDSLPDAPSPSLGPGAGDPRAAETAGGVVEFALGEAARSAVAGVARAERTTPFVVLLAALHVAIARQSGRLEFLISTPASGRLDPRFRNTIGLFTNTLLIPADLRGDPTVAAFVARTRASVVRALAHQDIPFHKIVETLRRRRAGDATPLVDLMFSAQVDRLRHVSPSERLVVRPHTLYTATAKFGASVSVTDVGDDLLGSCEHSLARYDGATVRRFVDEYAAVVTALAGSLDRPLSSLGVRSSGAAGPARAAAAPPKRPHAARELAHPRLADLWRSLLELDDVSPDTNFFEAGGQSLLAVELVHLISKQLGIETNVPEVFRHPTLAELDEHLTRLAADGAAIAESVPRLDLAVRGGRRRRSGGRPLVTGATGFLGVFLVRELLQRGERRVFCLVRDAAGVAPDERLRAAFERHGIWRPEYTDALEAVAGNAARPRLGLAASAFDALAAETATIYHAAAVTTTAATVDEMRAINVGGTAETLRLAAHAHAWVHHVSSTAVVANQPGDGKGRVLEDAEVDPTLVVGDYARSKWAAEQLVRQATAQGVRAAIYRLPRLSGDTMLGSWRRDDVFARAIAAWIESGRCPVELPIETWTPVDAAARALVELAANPRVAGRTVHVEGAQVRPADVHRALLDAGFTHCAPPPPAQPPASVADSRTARRLLGRRMPPPVIDRALLRRYVETLSTPEAAAVGV